MATWTDVARIAGRLPGIERSPEGRAWRVGDKLVAWERPLRKADLEALGAAAPTGPILGVHVTLDVKEMLLSSAPEVFFTTPHFDGYPAILLRLPAITVGALGALLEDAWRERVPARQRASLAAPARPKAAKAKAAKPKAAKAAKPKAAKAAKPRTATTTAARTQPPAVTPARSPRAR